ncbi:DNA polymerase V like [Lecanosticta acicola]|uniref:DNA polymerase V like n=1 Tax=Lecanosticta acicola TaxID=111012 RepID=A0AAI8Z8A2_9PEZI|nr:DNA polymerase V like [Lecanosticta acicola]
MAGAKRRRAEESTDAGADNVHPSRRRRVEADEAKAELAPIFNQLREEIPAQRLGALKRLLQNLSNKSGDPSGRLDYAVTRLVKGLCSGAKAARAGFSIALAEALRLGFASTLTLPGFVPHAISLTTPEGNVSGEERRNYLLGRRLAFRAVLQSDILAKTSQSDARHLFDAIAQLATEKDWLREECGAMLHEFLSSQQATQVQDEVIRSLIDSWGSKGFLKSPEGVALWLTVKNAFAGVKLPKATWHHNNPLSTQERATLTNILLKNAVESGDRFNDAAKKKSGARQIVPSFAWQVILAYLYKEDTGRQFHSFWEDCVAKPMFSVSSSTERRSLGLQVFATTIATAPVSVLGDVVHKSIMQCIIDHRAKPDRYLHEAAKLPLSQMATRAKHDPAAASIMICKLFTIMPGNLDKFTKATIENMLSASDVDGLADIVATAISLCRVPGSNDPGEAHQKRQMIGNFMLGMVRSRRSEPNQFFDVNNKTVLVDWLQALIRGFAHLAYTITSEKYSPPLSQKSQEVFRERLTSTLGHLVDLSLNQAILAPTLVLETLHESKKILASVLDEKRTAALREARKALKEAAKRSQIAGSGDATVNTAFQLLLALGMLQVYNEEEDDAIGVLKDIVSCYETPAGNEDASTMLVELLLSFVAKSSKLFQTLARQVFTAFASEVTPEGLQSMTEILSQKENLAGQQELFSQNGDENADGDSEEEEEEETDDDEEDAVDVEDESDIEILNGNVVKIGSEEDEEELSSSEEGEESSEADEDEEAAFDRKLADALGTTGMDEDVDEDGSDMDDEQMMALEGHLTNIFKERKKDANKKQDNKDAKDNIVNFKNRVLDLLFVYVKIQYANPIAMDLVHPLATLTRTTTNPPTAKKALEVLEQYFDTCKKHKSLPQLDSEKPCAELLNAIFSEMKLGGSKLHAAACSRSALFLAKVLIGKTETYRRVVDLKYLGLRDEWRKDPKSKIHGSLFNDWHNWSMQR